MNNRFTRRFLAASTACMLSLSAMQAAQAVPHASAEVPLTEQLQSSGQKQKITSETLDQPFQGLDQSDVPPNVKGDGTGELPLDRMELNLRDSHPSVLYLSSEKEHTGFWLEFTQLEQDIVLNGAGFALGAAICAIPGVGWIACAVGGAIIAGAAVVLSHNKKCDGRLRVEYSWAGKPTTYDCV